MYCECFWSTEFFSVRKFLKIGSSVFVKKFLKYMVPSYLTHSDSN